MYTIYIYKDTFKVKVGVESKEFLLISLTESENNII